jgi:RNA polymerase sigma factor (sigma-70 family)
MSDTDLELLARYTRNHAEEAFTEIVRRHIDLVFSAALRQVRSTQLAEEVVQTTFISLARDANRLAPDTILAAWLYQVAHHHAANVVRRETRRQLREQIATEMNAINAEDSSRRNPMEADWMHIEPHLDEAMRALDDTDRAAVLLRYFENKSLREVGVTLGTSENAAQKRLSRAIERLREFFAKRGVTVGASGLVAFISANAVQAAPSGLIFTISTAAALVGTTVATTATAAKTVVMTTLQKTLVGAILAAAVGTGIYEARKASAFRNQVSALEQQQTALAEQLARERDEATRQVAAARDNNVAELARLRGEVTRLRRETQEFAQMNVNSVQAANQVFKVSAINVTNTEPRIIGDEQIRANIRTQVGDAYSRVAIDQDVRTLYGTGLFSNIRVIENSNELGMTLTYVVKEKTAAQATRQTFENHGTATPEAAFQTFLWASKNGDTNLLGQMLRWRKEKEDAISDELASQITAAQARGMVKTFSNLASVQIIGQRSDITDTTRMRVEFNEGNGKTHLGEIYMIREDGDWKTALNFSRREGSTTTSAQFLMPATPELGPVPPPETVSANTVSTKTNFVGRRTAPIN